MKNSVKLSSNDRARMARLFEEVSGRLEEMSLIVGRTLQLDLDQSKVLKFSPSASSTKGATKRGHPQHMRKLRKKFKGTTIVCTSSGCGCYDNDSGICYAC